MADLLYEFMQDIMPPEESPLDPLDKEKNPNLQQMINDARLECKRNCKENLSEKEKETYKKEEKILMGQAKLNFYNGKMHYYLKQQDIGNLEKFP